MKKVITYGTFDLLHFGHINLLRRARQMGDYLIVGVSSDAFNALKGKTCYHTLKERVDYLKTLRCVDEILIEDNWEQKISDIQRNQVSVFVMGDDWRGKFDFLSAYCEVVYLSRTKEISSTQIKQIIHASGADSVLK